MAKSFEGACEECGKRIDMNRTHTAADSDDWCSSYASQHGHVFCSGLCADRWERDPANAATVSERDREIERLREINRFKRDLAASIFARLPYDDKNLASMRVSASSSHVQAATVQAEGLTNECRRLGWFDSELSETTETIVTVLKDKGDNR